jgi:hypothetical protein
MTNNDAIATVKPLTETEIAFLTARDRKIVRCTDGHDYVKMTCGRCGGSTTHIHGPAKRTRPRRRGRRHRI